MPPKKRGGLDTQHNRKRQKRQREKAAETKRLKFQNMTEEERSQSLRKDEARRNVILEKNRMYARIKRATMTPEEAEAQRTKMREHTRYKRRQQKIVPLQEEIKIIDWQMDSLKTQGNNYNLAEESKLKTRKVELERQIHIIMTEPTNRYLLSRNKKQLKAEPDDYLSTKADNQVNSDMEQGSDFETDALAELTLDKLEVIMTEDDDEDADQKMRPNETIQDWVQRMANPFKQRNESRQLEDGADSGRSGGAIESTVDRKGRIIAMKAKAKLFKLQKVPVRETREERLHRWRQLDDQRKVILKLIPKYPEEFNCCRPRTMAKQRRQRKNEIAAITKNNCHIVKSQQLKKSFLRFNRPRFESQEQKIQRLAAKLQYKGAKLDNETPEELAVRVLQEMEEEKKKYNIRKQTAADDVGNTEHTEAVPNSGSRRRIKDVDSYIETYKLKKMMETPEQRKERCTKAAEYARTRNKMEKNEYKLFVVLSNSDDPAKTIEDEPTASETLSYWYNDKNTHYRRYKAYSLPECLKEWRNKTYLLLIDGIRNNQSGEEKKLRLAKMNHDLKAWLEIHRDELDKYLTKRKNKLNDYLKKRPQKELTEEEKEEKRKNMNARLRERYLKIKLAQGIVITPKGERPFANKYYNTCREKTEKPKRSRKSVDSSSETPTPKRRNTKNKISKSSSFVMPESDMDSTSSGIPPPPPPSITSMTAGTPASCGISLTDNNRSVPWPSLGLVNPSVNESHLHHQNEIDDDSDEGDDWIPASNYAEQSFSTVNHNELGGSFEGNQFMGRQNSQTVQNSFHHGYDDLFHRLIQAPCQNNSNNVMSQVPSYAYAGFGHGHTFVQPIPNPVPLQQQQPNLTTVQLPQNSNMRLNYSASINQNPDLKVQAPWMTGTISQIHQDSGSSVSIDGFNNQSIPPDNYEEDSATQIPKKVKRTRRPRGSDSSVGIHGLNKCSTRLDNHEEVSATQIPIKVKRTRRPRGSDPIKRKRIRKPRDKTRPWRPEKGSIHIPTTTAPIVIETTTARLKCTFCPLVCNSEKMCREHIQRHHGPKPSLICKVCRRPFSKETHLLQHLWMSHRNFEPYKCPSCSKPFVKSAEFMAHLKRHHSSEERPFIIGITSRAIDAPEEAGKFWCDVCPTVFDSYLKAVIHRETHKYICTVCGIILKEGDHLLEHTFRCHPEVDWRGRMEENFYKPVEDVGNIFMCSTCDSEFLTQKFLSLHEASGHPRINKHEKAKRVNFYCDTCDKRLYRDRASDRHKANCHMKKFFCYWCCEVFSGADLRLKHMMKNHLQCKSIPKKFQGGYRKYKCELCRNSYNTILKVRSHFESFHIPRAMRAKHLAEFITSPDVISDDKEVKNTASNISSTVDINQTGSGQTTNLEVEANAGEGKPQPDPSHSDNLSQTSRSLVVYPCNICDSNYKTEEFLLKHVETTHPDNKRYRFICKVCNKSFYDGPTLQRHKRAYHTSAEAKKKFQCPQCPKQLTRAEHLRSHIKNVHENSNPVTQQRYMNRWKDCAKERPFVCDICPTRFKERSALKNHKRKAHQSKKVTHLFCEICGKQINAQDTGYALKRHVEKFHPEHAGSVQSYSSLGYGSTLDKLPLPDVIKLIEEIIQNRRRHDTPKEKIPRCTNKNSSKSKNNAKRKRKAKDSETEEEIDSEGLSSAGEWSTESSSSDESDQDSAFTSDSDVSGVSSSGRKNIRRISLKNIIVKPKKRMQKSHRKRPESDDKLNKRPTVVLEKCDSLVKKMTHAKANETESMNSDSETEESDLDSEQNPVYIPKNDFKRSTRPSNSTRRFVFDSDVSE